MIVRLFSLICLGFLRLAVQNIMHVELSELLCDSDFFFISKFLESGIQGVLPIFGLVFLFAFLDQFLLSIVHHDILCYLAQHFDTYFCIVPSLFIKLFLIGGQEKFLFLSNRDVQLIILVSPIRNPLPYQISQFCQKLVLPLCSHHLPQLSFLYLHYSVSQS